MSEDAQLITLDRDNAMAIFTDRAKVEEILSTVKQKVDGFKAELAKVDVRSKSGQKLFASHAFKVAKTKTYIEEIGASASAEVKKIPKLIDDNRKKIKDTLDEWRDDVRKPLSDWEAAEKERTDKIKASLAELEATIADALPRSAEQLRDRLAEVQREALSEQFYGEFLGAACELKDKAVSILSQRLAAAEKHEAEQRELQRLRAEIADREKKDREAKIAADAAEVARRQAEAKAESDKKAAEDAAKREREAAEKRELELRLQAEQAERRAAEAEAKAKRDAEAKAAAEAAAAAKREEDKAHRAAVFTAALKGLVDGGVAEDVATTVVKLIVFKQVPHVSINY